jgi:ATP-binding cassette subfamily F protein 3
MIKEKKMERIGNYREDGKRYKNFSLKKLDESQIRLAQKVQIRVDEPVINMRFPAPAWPPGISPGDAVVRAENLFVGYDTDHMILKDVTVELRRGSKVALVGQNGASKSTLVKLITGEHRSSAFPIHGSFWRHTSLRVGHVSQYTVEELEQYEHLTVIEYAEETLRSGKASAGIVANASGNVRQYQVADTPYRKLESCQEERE